MAKTKRLSIDLPEDYHNLLNEVQEKMGFSSGIETIRRLLDHYTPCMDLAEKGYRPVMRLDSNPSHDVELIGDPLSMLARKAHKKVQNPT